jgi:magnesium-protoporphyrin O-methyltransferase
MPDNCCIADYDAEFDEEGARRDLLAYRADGASGSTRRLIDALLTQGVAGATLLDIGGGIGVVQLALLAAGAARSVDVDASAPYLHAAEAEAAERGFGERTEYRHGDFVALADAVADADVVTLDRVICCYPDVAALISASAARARRMYGLVYPVDRWWTRLAVRLANLLPRLSRSTYRGHVHPQRHVDRLIREAGLVAAYHHAGIVWQTEVYLRPDT